MNVYLDYAASTPLDPEVREAMQPYLEATGNPSSIHRYGRFLRSAIEDTRAEIAELLGCSPSEIVFTSGGTEADNHAIRGAVHQLNRRTILYNPTEHHAVLHTIEDLAEKNFAQALPLRIFPTGEIDLGYLEDLLQKHSNSLVCVMHANNEIGTVQPVREIAELCKRYGALYHCDTVQTMGLGWVQVEELGFDFAAASAHKFYGPKGVGFLYRRHPVGSLISGGAQERNQRGGTENVAGIVGLGHALRKAYQEKERYVLWLYELKTYFVQRLRAFLSQLTFNGPEPDQGHPGILSVRFPLSEMENLLLMHLDLEGVAVSGTSACSSGASQPSHVLTALGLDPVQATHTLRFSWGKGITKEDLDYVLHCLRTILSDLQPI
ncbi:MAG: cysteine desulfurase family protein [Bacteroidia bacterium]